MPRPALRSRSYRKLKVRTPGGALKDRYERRRPSQAVCSRCRKPLGGVPRARPVKVGRAAKSRRRPERAFGGNLCPGCLKTRVKELKVYKSG